MSFNEKKTESEAAQFIKDELPRVFNLCSKLCQNRQDAEDLCQDVFIKALNGISRFEGKSSVSTWLYRITVNSWKNRIRHESRRKFKRHFSLSARETPEDEDLLSVELPSNEPPLHHRLEQREQRLFILSALDKLDSEHKTLLLLRDVEEKSYDEIAEILELNLGTVKSKLSRAREALREIVLRSKGSIS